LEDRGRKIVKFQESWHKTSETLTKNQNTNKRAGVWLKRYI
jgi:hypothetical protein